MAQELIRYYCRTGRCRQDPRARPTRKASYPKECFCDNCNVAWPAGIGKKCPCCKHTLKHKPTTHRLSERTRIKKNAWSRHYASPEKYSAPEGFN